MSMLVGLVLAGAAMLAIVDGSDVLGVFAANGMTMLALGVAAAALLIVAMMPRVGGRHEEVAVEDDRTGRFERDGHVAERRETTPRT